MPIVTSTMSSHGKADALTTPLSEVPRSHVHERRWIEPSLRRDERSSDTCARQTTYQAYSSSYRAYHRDSRRVYIPRTAIDATPLTSDDVPVWIESHSTSNGRSHGWLTSRRSLEAQGYYEGHRQVWVSKP